MTIGEQLVTKEHDRIMAYMKAIADGFYFLLYTRSGSKQADELAQFAMKTAKTRFWASLDKHLADAATPAAREYLLKNSRENPVEDTVPATQNEIPHKASFQAGFNAGYETAVKFARNNGCTHL